MTAVPELTGHRRYRSLSTLGLNGFMIVEVAVSVWSHTQNKWTTEWRTATPEDLVGETIVGLPDNRG